MPADRRSHIALLYGSSPIYLGVTYMTTQEKKDYIKKNWKVSSGKKITLMLYRYWFPETKIKPPTLIEEAQKIFQ